MKTLIKILPVILLISGFANSKLPEVEGIKMNKYEGLVDQGYEFTGFANGQMDTRSITLFRYQPKNDHMEPRFGAEHISTVVDEHGALKGLVRLKKALISNPQNLPDKEEALTVASLFLKEYAPDLVDDMSVQWIDVHSEKIKTNAGILTLEGMKVKCRKPSDGLYFWVIVAADRSVIAFERDIEWDFFRSGRKTEKWLHDSWLEEHSISFNR